MFFMLEMSFNLSLEIGGTILSKTGLSTLPYNHKIKIDKERNHLICVALTKENGMQIK